MIALLWGCSSAPPTAGPETADTGEAESADVWGVVSDPAGAPLGGVTVLGCTAARCLQVESGPDGRFGFPGEPGARMAIKTPADLYRIPRWGAGLVPVEADGEGRAAVGTVYVPELPPGAPLADEVRELDVGDGLILWGRRGDLVPELGTALTDVAARRLPEAHRPRYPELGDEEVIAVYGLHPFGASSDPPMQVEIATSLPEGRTVRFRTVSHLDGTLSEPVDGRSDGERARTPPGQGLDRTTQLVITAP